MNITLKECLKLGYTSNISKNCGKRNDSVKLGHFQRFNFEYGLFSLSLGVPFNCVITAVKEYAGGAHINLPIQNYRYKTTENSNNKWYKRYRVFHSKTQLEYVTSSLQTQWFCSRTIDAYSTNIDRVYSLGTTITWNYGHDYSSILQKRAKLWFVRPLHHFRFVTVIPSVLFIKTAQLIEY